MHLLEKMGMVKAVDFGDGAARFDSSAKNDERPSPIWSARLSKSRGDRRCFPEKVEKKIARKQIKAVTHKLEFLESAGMPEVISSANQSLAKQTGAF